MMIATYEQMKKYINTYNNNSFIRFKFRYFADSIDIMESWIPDDYENDYEILLTKAEANNFTKYTYNRLLGRLLMKLKTQQINKKLERIKEDF